MIIEQMFLMQT
jgi:hypothetical protein